MHSSRISNVLIVDDEPALRELLVDALSADDLQITTAASGQEAMDLAGKLRPDLLVTDVCLGDYTGLEVIDRLRSADGQDIPAVIITGQGDPQMFSEASRRRPVEVMTKPLDLERLRKTIREELSRRERFRRLHRRTRQLRKLARVSNIERKRMHRQLDSTCADLTSAYRNLSGQMGLQQVLINYQRELLTTTNDDEVFRALFRLFVVRTGPVFGVAMVCDKDAELQIVGRFGVPYPDNSHFSSALAKPLVQAVLDSPQLILLDAGEEADLFEESIRKYLVGVTTLVIPLIPSPGELIGLVVLYRKGEQPFTDGDVGLAEMASQPTAVAIQRNE